MHVDPSTIPLLLPLVETLDSVIFVDYLSNENSIYSENGQNSIESLIQYIINNNGNGISLYGNNATIFDNYLYNNGGFGISLTSNDTINFHWKHCNWQQWRFCDSRKL